MAGSLIRNSLSVPVFLGARLRLRLRLGITLQLSHCSYLLLLFVRIVTFELVFRFHVAIDRSAQGVVW